METNETMTTTVAMDTSEGSGCDGGLEEGGRRRSGSSSSSSSSRSSSSSSIDLTIARAELESMITGEDDAADAGARAPKTANEIAFEVCFCFCFVSACACRLCSCMALSYCIQHTAMRCPLPTHTQDLPPVSRAGAPSVPPSELVAIGTVQSVVDGLVVVESRAGCDPLDMDSWLWLATAEPIGQVHDVFGPVLHPFYSVRYDARDAPGDTLVPGAAVYSAPRIAHAARFVFAQQLRAQQPPGCDASGWHDEEVASGDEEYSDDEAEREAKARRKGKKVCVVCCVPPTRVWQCANTR